MDKLRAAKDNLEGLIRKERSGELLKPGDLVVWSMNWHMGLGWDPEKDGPMIHGIILGLDTEADIDLEAGDDRRYLVNWVVSGHTISYPWTDLEPHERLISNSNQ